MLDRASMIFSHPFIYDNESLNTIDKKSKSAIKHEDALLPYIENFFYFKRKNDNHPPFTLTIHEHQTELGILIRRKNHKEDEQIFKMMLSVNIHFFSKNLAILVITINNPLYQSKNNINWNVSEKEQLSFLNNSLSIISEKWNHQIKIYKIFNKNDYVSTIDGYNKEGNIENNKFSLKNIKNNKIRVSGFDDSLYNEQCKSIQSIMDKHKLLYDKQKNNQTTQEFILSFIKPFVKSEDQKHLNPFNRTRTYTYITLLSSEDNDMGLVDTLLSQKKYNKNSSIGAKYLPWKISNMVNIYANENCLVTYGTQDQTNYMKRNYIDNYMEKYYRVYLIVLYQKSKLEELILRASQLNFDDAISDQKNYQLTIANLKKDILYYMTKIDYTNFSSNANRNAFYRFNRNIYYIKDLHLEAVNVISKINNELQEIKEQQLRIEKIQEDKKKDRWTKIAAGFASLISVFSIPIEVWQFIYQFLKSLYP